MQVRAIGLGERGWDLERSYYNFVLGAIVVIPFRLNISAYDVLIASFSVSVGGDQPNE